MLDFYFCGMARMVPKVETKTIKKKIERNLTSAKAQGCCWDDRFGDVN